jgi:hypothetical protein
VIGRWQRVWGIVFVSIAIFVSSAQGADAVRPLVESIYPSGGQRGTDATVTITGKFEGGPLKVWTDTPSIVFEPAKKPDTFTVHIAKDAPLGPHLVRVYTPTQAMPPRVFIVGEQPEVAEVEPNDERTHPQDVPQLPVTVNGQLDKVGDVDCYAIKLESGQTLVASVQGRRLGSAIDPMLHLFDESGVEVAYVQDGLGLDPLLAYRVPRSGNYVLRVSAFAYPPAAEVKLAGGKDPVYRLSLTTGPFVRGSVPAGVTRGQKTNLRLLGWNLESDRNEADATTVSSAADHLFVLVPGAESRLRIELGEGPEVIGGSDAARATLAPPFAVNGTIAAAGEEDRYRFTAKKGDRLSIGVRAGAIGSPLDAVLRIEDAAGKQLVAAEDPAGAGNPKLEWTAPADGTFTAVITDYFARGGEDYRYRLSIARPTPQIRATVDADAYTLQAGKSTPIQVQITLKNGHGGRMIAAAINLPPGVTATSAEIPEKSADATITLTAAADTKAASAPIRIMLLATDVDRPEATVATYDLKKDRDKAGVSEYFDDVADVWLSVLPPEKPMTAPATAPTTKPIK